MLKTIGRVALAGVLAALAGGQAWAATPITSCPFIITTPGNYVVTADLLCKTDGIDIQASNVTVNLNGHTIQSVASSIGTNGIYVSSLPAGASRLDHVGISGPGLIENFYFGIFIQESDYSQVSLTTVTGYSAGGIWTQNTDYLTLGGNVVTRNAGNNFRFVRKTHGYIRVQAVCQVSDRARVRGSEKCGSRRIFS